MQLNQNRIISDNLRSLTPQQIKKLPDEEIYNYLRNEIGISVGPCVESTRALYEKLLSESVGNLDNLDEFLSNYTKTGEEARNAKRSANRTANRSAINRTSDSGFSMNSIDTDRITNNNLQNLSRPNGVDLQRTAEGDPTVIESPPANKSSVSNKSNLSNKSSVSTRSNKSSDQRLSSNEDSSSDLNKSTNLNINLTQESITSPIPLIRVNNVDTNFDKKWSANQATVGFKETRCSTPIDRQAIFQSNNPRRVERTSLAAHVDLDHHQPIGQPIGQPSIYPATEPAVLASRAAAVENPFAGSLLKKANLNRNVFKNYVAPSAQRSTAPPPPASNNGQFGAFQPTTANLQQPTVDFQLQQFSDKEDDEAGVEFEYKVPKQMPQSMIRPRLNSRVHRLVRNDNSRKAGAPPQYNTNQAPSKAGGLYTILALFVALVVFSVILAIASYF